MAERCDQIAPRRFIRELDERYQVPKEWNPIRVLTIEERPYDGGGTSTYRVYVCLCEEVDTDA